ncbi:MAG: alpha/beta hydrolase [Ignavibacteriae bacterium HGW-Ignavibacteriae-3]|nr:MAG: alpha/beta hydrolase [Ignavibacteriae bacterium HGW-Ignavibacteriae-3]
MKNNSILIALLFILIPSVNVFSQETVLSKDGVKINFYSEGNGEPALVFIHGWSCDKSYWDYQTKYFSQKYKVVAIDLAGHGESGVNRENYTMELFGEDVAAVVDNLNLKKVVLIGHSMGGAVIIEAANILKNKVLGLIGADTFQNLGETLSADQIELFLKPFKENFRAHTEEFVKSMFPPAADPELVKKVSEDMASAPTAVAVSAMENMFKENAVLALKEINAPIISINCDLYPIQEEENRKVVKSYELKLMKGVGHFIMLEDPAKFNQLLSESVDELSK